MVCLVGIDELDDNTKGISRLPAIQGSNPEITVHEESGDDAESKLNKTSDNQTHEHDERVCDKTDSSGDSNIGGGCAIVRNSSQEDGKRVLAKQDSITVDGTCETSSSTDNVNGRQHAVNGVVIETKHGNQLVESVEPLSKIQGNNSVDKNANCNNAVTESSNKTEKRKQLVKQTSVHQDPALTTKLSVERQLSVAEAEAEAMVGKAEDQVCKEKFDMH